MLHLEMQPGSVLPAHPREGVAEALYVVEGTLSTRGSNTSNTGRARRFTTGKLHGPHSALKGCKILVLCTAHAVTQEANLGDFTIAKVAAATE